MLFAQFVDSDLGCASYLIGCEEAGEAIVVDPPYAVEPLLAEAESRDVRVVRVVETHTHADHLAGHGRLALDHGVPVTVHPLAGVEHPHDTWEDGDSITVGNVSLRCIHTPGHRPEHCCVTVTDHSRADEPWLVLTGDSLFVGDTARPDLAVAGQEGAEGLFHSLRRLLELPDGVEVYPGHVAGSLCGRAMSSKASTTVGFERRFNPMLALGTVEAFVATSATIAAPKPPNLTRIVDLNRGPWVPSPTPVDELPVPPGDCQLLDVRDEYEYFAGHHSGALCIPVGGTSFATKAGFVFDPERPLCVLASSYGQAERAIRGLRSVAFTDFAGYVLGGGSERMEPVTIEELDGLLDAGAELIDVREKDERDTGYVPGSRNVPYRLMGSCCPDLPTDRPVLTICESGPRAVIAASILATRGYDARPVMGGVGEWETRGGELVTFRRCGSA